MSELVLFWIFAGTSFWPILCLLFGPFFGPFFGRFLEHVFDPFLIFLEHFYLTLWKPHWYLHLSRFQKVFNTDILRGWPCLSQSVRRPCHRISRGWSDRKANRAWAYGFVLNHGISQFQLSSPNFSLATLSQKSCFFESKSIKRDIHP